MAKLQAAAFAHLSDPDQSKSDPSESDASKSDPSKSGKNGGFDPSESGGDPSVKSDKGGRYVFLIKAATSEVWWPEDADHIAFIRGRIGFELPAWFIPKDEKQVPTGAFFAGAIAVFDKTWKGPAISYIGRDELEAGGEAFLAQIHREAKRLVGKVAV